MQKAEKMQQLRVFAQEIRVEALKEFKALGFGHVGGSMSVVEALAVLYGDVMKVDPKNPRWEDRDWCVMSKGHAGPAVYATLGLKGFYPLEDILTLNKPGTNFPSHTDRTKTLGVDLTTGSLGQGVSTAIGAALGNRVDGRDNHVFLFVGDGECDEGQVWEGAQCAAHYKLDNLICFVDSNKYQLDGPVDTVLTHGDIGGKFAAFGWHVIDVKDGNDVEQVYDAVHAAYEVSGKPICIVLNTSKGKGCTFAEPSHAHSSQPKPEELDEALAAAEKILAELKA